jgi:hypothetical protein
MKITEQYKKNLAKVFTGINVKELAFDLGTSGKVIYNIKYGFRPPSPLRAIEIENITKDSKKYPRSITRVMLRPDIFGN